MQNEASFILCTISRINANRLLNVQGVLWWLDNIQASTATRIDTDSQVSEAVTCLCNVTLSVAEGPDNGINDKLELVRRHGKESSKAVVSDGPQQAKELQPVLRELLQMDRHSSFLTVL